MVNRGELTKELVRIRGNGVLAAYTTAANRYPVPGRTDGITIPPSKIAAIGSRETNNVNELGDYRNGKPHGIGILQADIQHLEAHAALASGRWRTHPEELIDWCVSLFASYLRWSHAAYPQYDMWVIAFAAYNEGEEGAKRSIDLFGSVDAGTTGHDYGHDTAARAEVFRQLMGESPL